MSTQDARARLAALRATVRDLKEQRDKGMIDQGRYTQLFTTYQQQIAALEEQLGIRPPTPSGGVSMGQDNVYEGVQIGAIVGGDVHGGIGDVSFAQPQPQPQKKRTNILVVFANPKGTSALRLSEEDRIVKESLRLSRHRDKIALETLHAARIDDVRRALLDADYHIVHFSGHGKDKGGLMLEDEVGQKHEVPPEALAELLALFDSIQCVVLNACYTQEQAALVAEGVPYVIGMETAISDEAAREFTRGFYDTIGAGKDISFAYKLGRNAIRLKGFTDEGQTPRLFGVRSKE